MYGVPVRIIRLYSVLLTSGMAASIFAITVGNLQQLAKRLKTVKIGSIRALGVTSEIFTA